MNTILGILFLVTGTLATFLMYHLWGYPYDKEKHESAAPQSLVFIHRVLGYTYIGIYIYLMIQMVPRLWLYQIELPARTVVHLVCGILIGAILIIKLMIVRFFRHLEGTLIPFLGTTLLLLTVCLISLSIPFAIRESVLSQRLLEGEFGLQENLERINRHLTDVGLDDEGLKTQLSTARGLMQGRKVLNNRCVTCHDLRTVLVRPKTAKQWYQTVKSMASRSDIFSPISQQEQWQVTAYLIAISPDLQRSVAQQKSLAQAQAKSAAAIKSIIAKSDSRAGNSPPDRSTSPTSDQTDSTQSESADSSDPTPPPETYQPPENYSAEQAQILFEIKCTDCHSASKLEENPPGNLDEVRSLVARMVEKGMEGTKDEFEILIHYVKLNHVK